MQSLQESNQDPERANNSRAVNIYLRVTEQKIERKLFIYKCQPTFLTLWFLKPYEVQHL